jgi:biopolymer transport protein ExbB/TolQ
MNTTTTGEWMPAVTLVLSLAALIGPLVFGFAVWKMSQIFVSKESFEDFKHSSTNERGELRKQLQELSRDMIELLERTAHLRNNQGRRANDDRDT